MEAYVYINGRKSVIPVQYARRGEMPRCVYIMLFHCIGNEPNLKLIEILPRVCGNASVGTYEYTCDDADYTVGTFTYVKNRFVIKLRYYGERQITGCGAQAKY